jgi:hypothetical protein
MPENPGYFPFPRQLAFFSQPIQCAVQIPEDLNAF